jgi:hypothetical protein
MRYDPLVKLFALGALAIMASGQLHAKSTPIDPQASSKALGLLLAASNSLIPESSSCQGNYGQTGKATVKDLLAIQLAYLYAGKNVIQGNCSSKQCAVTITHASGDDVSSAIITFNLKQGKASIPTLQCVITP